MSNTLTKVLIFAAGAVAGSAATYALLREKCERDIREEVDAYKAYVQKKQDEQEVEEQEELEAYEEFIDDSEYITNEKGVEISMEQDRPYIIPPEELGDEDHDIETLTYYADGVVTDELDRPMSEEDVEEFIGRELFDHFGDYEDDAIHVRNDAIRKDYEILHDTRAYSSFH